MGTKQSRRFSITLAVVWTPLLFSSFVGVSIAQGESAGARSATPYYDEGEAAAAARSLVTPGLRTYRAAGGTDVPLIGRNEPAVAVNPWDPTNVVVAGLFEIRVSTDTGETFTSATPSPVPGTHVRCGDPSVAFDSRGRLFWTFLGCIGSGIDVFIAQVNPLTGAIIAGPFNVTAAAGVPGSAGNGNDKEWLAIDRFVGSPFQDRIYVVWTNFLPTGGTVVQTTFSTDQGANWSPALTVSAGGEGFVWPSHNAVAANGDVYVSYHSQPTFAANAPNGTSGQIFVLRSTDGGALFPQKNAAYTGGNADITFNVQFGVRTLNQNRSWTQGAAQPWVLPDPLNANNVYVIAGDDPTNTAHGGTNDDLNVYIVRSTDSGSTWSSPTRIDRAPANNHSFFPTATIDDKTACIVVNWYDTRNGATNVGGNFLLDLFTTISNDGGLTFASESRINDAPFDPDLGAPDRFPPTRTLRIGEYIGVAVSNGLAHSVWTGNTATGQQILYENSLAKCHITVDLDIKPGSVPNSINTKSKGVIPVAILSTATFDATSVDPRSVTFGPGAATEAHGRGHIEDVNGDSIQDLVLHFSTQQSGLDVGDTRACVDGTTYGGAPIHGCDTVRTVR